MTFAGKKHTPEARAKIAAAKNNHVDVEAILDAYAAGLHIKVIAAAHGFAEPSGAYYHVACARGRGDPRAARRIKSARLRSSPEAGARVGTAGIPAAVPTVSASSADALHGQQHEGAI